MAKGEGKYGRSKRSHYPYKRRCEIIGCKKRAKYIIGGKYLCKIHSR